MEHDLRIAQLNFIGRILASYTHELKNHLAVIKESAGLQHDIISFGGKKVKLEPAEMLKFLTSIDDEILKTLRLTTFLNRYAHRNDTERSVFSVNEAVEELVALTARLGRLKRITLRAEYDVNVPMTYSDPAKLELLLFCLIDEELKTLDSKSVVTVRTALSGNAITVSVLSRGERTADPTPGGMCTGDLVDVLLTDLGGAMSRTSEDGGTTISLPVTAADETPA